MQAWEAAWTTLNWQGTTNDTGGILRYPGRSGSMHRSGLHLSGGVLDMRDPAYPIENVPVYIPSRDIEASLSRLLPPLASSIEESKYFQP